MSENRENQVIQRIRESLIEEGVKSRVVRESAQYGLGSAKSYAEALLDLRLEGKGNPTAQEVWEEMKAQINFLTGALIRASEDYSKLETGIRGLKEDLKDKQIEVNELQQRLKQGEKNEE